MEEAVNRERVSVGEDVRHLIQSVVGPIPGAGGGELQAAEGAEGAMAGLGLSQHCYHE